MPVHESEDPNQPSTAEASPPPEPGDQSTAEDSDDGTDNPSSNLPTDKVPKSSSKGKAGKRAKKRSSNLGNAIKKTGTLFVGGYEVPAERAASLVAAMDIINTGVRGNMISVIKRIHEIGGSSCGSLGCSSVGAPLASVFHALLQAGVYRNRDRIVYRPL